MSQPVDKKTFLTIFTTVFLPMFLAAVDQTLLATATPAMVRDLGDMQLSSWIAVGYMLAGRLRCLCTAGWGSIRA